MRLPLIALFGVFSFGVLAQTAVPDQPQNEPKQNETIQDEAKPNETKQTPPLRDEHSALKVKPGGQVIKQKDLWTDSGYFHPFLRMPKYILYDQKAIWTSPFHTAKSDIQYWVIFGTAVGGLIAADRHIEHALPTSSTWRSVSNSASDIGSAYSLIPLSAGFYFLGTKAHHDRLRETGLLCFETLINSNLVVLEVKLIANRARPFQNNGHGGFEDGPSRWNSGFPSGHSINSWALASVIAHQYPHPRIVPILAYALATTVGISRVGARQHFPGDVVAGGAMGWFIGDYVFGRRHNPELDQKRSAAQEILALVRVGGAQQ
jgi:membrane-associated phospholipid phosphatase